MFNKKSDRISVHYEFDKGEAVFEVGDTVSGTAIITAHEETVCHKVVVQMRWQTHGKGNRDAGKWMKESTQVSDNKLSANETQKIPFSFTLPEGPLTYRGGYLNIDWYLKTIIDARGPFDPSYEEEIIVLPKVLETAYKSQYGSHRLQQPKSSATNNTKLDLIIALAMLSSSLIMIGLVLFIGIPPFFIIFGLILLAISSVFFYKNIRNSLSTQKLGPVKMALSQTELLPDETLSCQLSFNPLKDVLVKSINFKLQGDEKVISGSGSNKKTYTSYIFKQQRVQLENKSLLANKAVSLEQSLKLPPNAAYSFAADDNKIEWFCEVTIDIEGWPNWSERLDIQVVPWRVVGHVVGRKFESSTNQNTSNDWAEHETESLA